MKLIEKLIKDNYTGIEFDYSRGRMSIEFGNVSKEKIAKAFFGDVRANLLNEYEETEIKLTQFEKDLLETILSKEYNFNTYQHLLTLKEKGYYKGIIDVEMSIQEILDKYVIGE